MLITLDSTITILAVPPLIQSRCEQKYANILQQSYLVPHISDPRESLFIPASLRRLLPIAYGQAEQIFFQVQLVLSDFYKHIIVMSSPAPLQASRSMEEAVMNVKGESGPESKPEEQRTRYVSMSTP